MAASSSRTSKLKLNESTRQRQQLWVSSPSISSTSQRVMKVYLAKKQKLSLDFMRMIGGQLFSFARSWSFSLLGLNRPDEIAQLKVDVLPADGTEETLQFCEDIKRKTVGLGGEAFEQLSKHEAINVSFKIKAFSDKTKEAVITIRVDGPFITRLLKEYEKPLKMNVRVKFGSHYRLGFGEQRMVCKDMKPKMADLIDDRYCFEQDVEVKWFPALVQKATQLQQQDSTSTSVYLDGEVTIKLIGDIESVLGWVPPCDNEFLCRRFLEESKFSDFTLLSEDNKEFPCHKLFLGGHSPVFAAMFETECKETREKSCKMQLSQEGVKALLKFLYYSNVDDPLSNSSVALELLGIGHQYCIASLENSMKAILQGKPAEWFDKEVALLLFLRSRKLDDDYADLKKKAVQIVKAKGAELNVSCVIDEILKDDPDSAKELLVLLSTT